MLTVTDLAKSKILALMESEDRKGLALRISIPGRGPGGFRYELGFVEGSDKRDDDTVVDAGGFQILVDKETVPNLQGSTLDFVDGVHESGFKIDNPNPLWHEPLAQKVQEVIDSRINPGIASHGGFVVLLNVEGDTAYVQLGGGCQGCGMADVTLKQGVEVMIKEAVPEIKQVIDSTDHAGGKNPYYQPSKGGPSPMG
jgi:Fe/S biogenesis protein NfuA